MSLARAVTNYLNRILRGFNVRVDSLTAERAEMKRLSELEVNGHFEGPVFPVLDQFRDCDPSVIFAELANHEKRYRDFATNPKDGGCYSFDNEYFTSPDAEVLYAIVQLCKPHRIIEVGSGNSTLLSRQAITDAGLTTRMVSIDPHPRREIARYSDEVFTERVENLRDLKPFLDLTEGDILFIDSSHEVKVGNDVLFLLFQVLPSLQPGVVIHIHDIFLPYEYPRRWLVEEKWGWAEQYLVHAFLQGSTQYDVLWAGHYFQANIRDFNNRFLHGRGANAQSLWLRKR